MRTLGVALCVVLAFGCDLMKVDTGAGASSATAAAGSSSSSSGAATTAQGTNCAVDPETGTTLCTGISVCPGVSVDHDAYPDCGFRINGSALDVECSCNGSLCPAGVAATCSDIQSLLAQQTQTTVCLQISEGRCTTPTGASTTTSATTGTSASTCDTTCRDECAGEPTCMVGCGC